MENAFFAVTGEAHHLHASVAHQQVVLCLVALTEQHLPGSGSQMAGRLDKGRDQVAGQTGEERERREQPLALADIRLRLNICHS
ncbi:hypothetical protein D3C78_1487430 [compost metagenome]